MTLIMIMPRKQFFLFLFNHRLPDNLLRINSIKETTVHDIYGNHIATRWFSFKMAGVDVLFVISEGVCEAAYLREYVGGPTD